METDMNKEVSSYKENVVMGLNVRQLVWLILAAIVSIVVYFYANPRIGSRMTALACMIVSAPCILMGFFRYNEMSFDKCVIAWFRFYFLVPRILLFKPENGIVEASIEIENEESGKGKKAKAENKKLKKKEKIVHGEQFSETGGISDAGN